MGFFNNSVGLTLCMVLVGKYLLILLVLVVLTVWILYTSASQMIPDYENEQVCYGTSAGFTIVGDALTRYQKYKASYTNCTYLSGNLEIVFLNEPGVDYDMSFLSQIKEVTGYVLIAGNNIDYIPLTSLRIIRGSTLLEHRTINESFSLIVAFNYLSGVTRGLRELRFTNLSEILNGKVFFQSNDKLCFENTINWKDITRNMQPPVFFISDSKTPKRQCDECHESCYSNVTKSKHCWGQGPTMCQKLSFGDVCHGNCGEGRCYGRLPNQCCHPQCAGGCTQSKNTDCFACLMVKNEGECVPFCPKEKIYDSQLMIEVKNPDMKYTFGSVCVKQCPEFLLQDNGNCVRQCFEGKHAKDGRNCEPCNGPCPKISDSQICSVLEGREITLTCTVLFDKNSTSEQFIWNQNLKEANVNIVAACDTNDCSNITNPRYKFTVTRINESNSISTMTIASAARTDQGLWFCSSAQDVSVCDVKVFARPTNVTCSQPKLHNDTVVVTCTGDRVYPQPLCLFTWIKNGLELSTFNVRVKNQSLSQSQNTDYFYPACTWKRSSKALGFGSHQFNVLIYPNVTRNRTTDMSYGTNSSLTSPIEIIEPELVLESCPQDYIKEGTTVSCTCREKSNSFLQADVVWTTSRVLVVEKQITTFNFTVQRNSPNHVCSAVVLGFWISKIFVPRIAYGPDQVVMKVKMNGVDKTVTDLCGNPQTSQTMRVYCTVPDVRPSELFVRYFIDGNFVNGINQTVGSAGSVDYQVTGGGMLSVKCTANNTEFSDIYTENTTFLIVREPPNAPVLQAEPGNSEEHQRLNVREGLVRIWCRVDGGYPTVTNLTLNCDGSSTSGQNAIFVEKNVTRKMNSQACSCTATHPSTCYVNNRTTSTLNVLYPPAVTNFTVTGAVNQEVQDNTTVMFSCEAEGNPAPSLTLLRDSDSQLLRQTDRSVFQLNKIMRCQDSGIYVCKSQSQEGEGKETVKIYVLCKPQLAPTESQNRVYGAAVNKLFDINITVYGYPEPELLSLHSSTALKEGTYNLEYYSTTSGNGVVRFQIYTFLETYFQKYEINITNTQGSFVYSFEILAGFAEPNSNTAVVASVVVGILAGLFFIILVITAVYTARMKEILNRTIKRKNGPILRYTVGEYEESDTVYFLGANEESDPCSVNTVQLSSPYIEVVDNLSDTASVSHTNDITNEDTQTYSLYEEIRDVQVNLSSGTGSPYVELFDDLSDTAGVSDTNDVPKEDTQTYSLYEKARARVKSSIGEGSPYVELVDNLSDTAGVSDTNEVPNEDTQTYSPYEEVRAVPTSSSIGAGSPYVELVDNLSDTAGVSDTNDILN